LTKKLLIAGASGFLGRNLTKDLPGGWDVVVTYNANAAFPSFLKSEALKHLRALRVDLADAKQVESRLGGTSFDAIVNLAGNADIGLAQSSPHEDLRSNVSSVINLRTHCKTDHFVHFSSGAVYDGNIGAVSPSTTPFPRLPYAISKLAAEHYAASLHLDRGGVVTIIRFFGAYGPYEPRRKIFSRLVRAFSIEQANVFSVVGDGKNLVDAMYVGDAIQGIKQVLEHPHEEGIVDFSKGEALSIDSLVRRSAETFGIHDVRINHTGQPPEYITFKSTPDRFEKLFGFRPHTPLEKGLRLLAKWVKDQQK
jgi:nucleoside-diphosphate-sugar epimerase